MSSTTIDVLLHTIFFMWTIYVLSHLRSAARLVVKKDTFATRIPPEKGKYLPRNIDQRSDISKGGAAKDGTIDII